MSDIPVHVGYIVDGNRRWAKKHGLPNYEGHLAGYNAIKDVAIATLQAGAKYMSAYIFSTENWKRSEEEVGKLFGLILKLLTDDLHFFGDYNVKLVIAGTRDGLSDSIISAINKDEDDTKDNTAGTLMLSFNYGGQQEIEKKKKKIVQTGAQADEITPELIGQNLYSPEVPPCDVIVRTSGEQRLSNFMLWRAAYSELIFLEKYWPDMTADDVTAIIEEYKQRNRRLGG